LGRLIDNQLIENLLVDRHFIDGLLIDKVVLSTDCSSTRLFDRQGQLIDYDLI